MKAPTDAKASRRNKRVSRPGRCGEVTATLASVREALACAEGRVAALKRILEREVLMSSQRGLSDCD